MKKYNVRFLFFVLYSSIYIGTNAAADLSSLNDLYDENFALKLQEHRDPELQKLLDEVCGYEPSDGLTSQVALFEQQEDADSVKTVCRKKRKVEDAPYRSRTYSARHKCLLCNKKFPTPSKLKRHQIIHTKEKKFKCQMCEQLFTQVASLRRHEEKNCKKRDIV